MRFFRNVLLPCVLLFAFAGCRQDDEIKTEIFTNPDRELIRKLVAVFESDKVQWVILLSGPDAEVKKHKPEFDTFVASVRFEKKGKDGLPVPIWVQPKEWREDPPGGRLRFAGFRIDAKPKELELTVSRFPADDFSLLGNINRWEKQLALPPSVRLDQLGPNVKRDRIKVGDQPVDLIELSGLAVHTVSRPPVAMAKADDHLPPLDLKGKTKGNRIPFKYKAPADWIEKPANSIELVVFEIADAKTSAKLSLTSVGGSVGKNINRWRGQVQLPEFDDAEAQRAADRLMIAGVESYYVDLANPRAKNPDRNRILAVTIPLETGPWHVKMFGPIELLERNKAAFETFVKSFELDSR